jgi:hypothetical protein
MDLIQHLNHFLKEELEEIRESNEEIPVSFLLSQKKAFNKK